MTNADDLPDEEVWIASGDVRIPLVKMSDNHLRNAANYMKKTLNDDDSEDEDVLTDLVEKLDKLEGEVARRLNIEIPDGEPPLPSPPSNRPPSLTITPVRQAADDAYRSMGR